MKNTEDDFNIDINGFENFVSKFKDGLISEEEISNMIETGSEHLKDKEKLDKLNSFLGTELGQKCSKILNSLFDENDNQTQEGQLSTEEYFNKIDDENNKR